MRKIFFKIKLNLKGILHTLLQFISIFAFAWYQNCIFEMLIVYVCFFYFRSKFIKQFHASSSWGCTILTMIIFFFISRILPDKNLSVIVVIIFTYFINKVSYYVRDYIDIKYPKKKKKNTNRQLIIDKLGEDNLSERSIEKYCVKHGFPNLSETIYLFLNNTLEDTADILEIDTSTITRRINKFLKG